MDKTYNNVTPTETDLQALMAAISSLRSIGRVMTANDLADLLVRFGGPDMRTSSGTLMILAQRHEGLA